ncbi:CPBP family intramembrane glutamic endopeptidase [Iningainema tapete]|uniref:CPBP family intramembrane metalloprotease n=1 Tax=Iningainema tapete BLCC-T55 TaxID=2748662 RepID=A0A8J7BZ06_9CYAN|nr:type II CAAX endopeptidase family protein [Iningainema tapete]MBD2774933.1 CPBP family intramembrane metalloprotease [Iningainema tapete BLCC-T55]
MKINFYRLAQQPAPIRLICFTLTLLMLWLPIAVPIYLLVRDTNLITILTIPPLYVEFVILLRLWGKYVYQQQKLLQHYGLELTRLNGVDLLHGLATGLISIVFLFGVEGILGWLWWQQPKVFLVKVILEGLVVGVAYGFAEELLFRGWLLDELQRDYSPTTTLWANAVAFATLHFIKPKDAIIHTLPQFPALVLLGLTLVWGKRWSRGRLGFPMGLHGGIIWGYYIINVGELVKYSGQVPDWVTGVNNNPLAGVMGLLFLSVLALWMRAQAFRYPPVGS